MRNRRQRTTYIYQDALHFGTSPFNVVQDYHISAITKADALCTAARLPFCAPTDTFKASGPNICTRYDDTLSCLSNGCTPAVQPTGELLSVAAGFESIDLKPTEARLKSFRLCNKSTILTCQLQIYPNAISTKQDFHNNRRACFSLLARAAASLLAGLQSPADKTHSFEVPLKTIDQNVLCFSHISSSRQSPPCELWAGAAQVALKDETPASPKVTEN